MVQRILKIFVNKEVNYIVKNCNTNKVTVLTKFNLNLIRMLLLVLVLVTKSGFINSFILYFILSCLIDGKNCTECLTVYRI